MSATGTVIGVEIAQNPATQLYQAKLGYNRAELAIVPTDKVEGGTNNVAGASSTADVIMELRYQGMLSFSDQAGIYQRLAVGKVAVSQPGAAFMFAKGPDGTLSPVAADAVVATVKSEVIEPDFRVTQSKLPLALAYQKSTNKPAFDIIAEELDFGSFSEFLVHPGVPTDVVAKMVLRLKANNLIP